MKVLKILIIAVFSLHCTFLKGQFQKYYKNKAVKYYILNDSTLIVDKKDILANDEMWYFNKISEDSFKIYRITGDYKEFGQASSLNPLIKNGEFIVIGKENNVVFWEYYRKNFSYHGIIEEFNDTVFNSNCVDILPEFPAGYIELRKNIINNMLFIPTRECSISGTIYLKCVIDKKGYIRNVGIFRSNGDEELEYEAIKAVSKLNQKFNPALKDGKAVNVNYILKIETNL